MGSKTKLFLQGDPFIDGFNDDVYYKCFAVDEEGKEYTVIWYPFENYKEMDDESNCCDWDNPDEIFQEGRATPVKYFEIE